jgi:3-oxoacyl-[acyl-carrier protein] reductase
LKNKIIKMKSLKGKKALVTGGGKGIGKAIALALAAEGVDVAITGRNKVHLEETVVEIKQMGVQSAFAAFDVSIKEQTDASLQKLITDFGVFDILINNAGIATFGGLLELAPEKWEEIIRTNLFGPYYVSLNLVPGMIQKKSGDIINISSTAGLKGGAGTSAYSASKAALIALSESMMYELRKQNIRVCTLTPSTIATDLAVALKLTDGNPEKVLQPEDIAEIVVDILKLKSRVLLANAALFSTNP